MSELVEFFEDYDPNEYEVVEEIVKCGKNCALEFFGMDLNRALNIWQGFCDIVDDLEEIPEPGERLSSGGWAGYSMDKVVEYARTVYSFDSVYRKSDHESYDGYQDSTANDIRMLFTAHADIKEWKNQLQAKNRYDSLPSVDEIKEKIVELFKDVDKSKDFGWNLDQACFDNEGNLRKQTSKIGILAFVVFKAINAIMNPHDEKKEKKTSNWIGSVKERLDITMKIVMVRNVYSNWGGSVLIKGIANGSDVVSFFSQTITDAAVGEEIKIKGTVKELAEFKGEKQTTMTRVKIID